MPKLRKQSVAQKSRVQRLNGRIRRARYAAAAEASEEGADYVERSAARFSQ